MNTFLLWTVTSKINFFKCFICFIKDLFTYLFQLTSLNYDILLKHSISDGKCFIISTWRKIFLSCLYWAWFKLLSQEKERLKYTSVILIVFIRFNLLFMLNFQKYFWNKIVMSVPYVVIKYSFFPRHKSFLINLFWYVSFYLAQ